MLGIYECLFLFISLTALCPSDVDLYTQLHSPEKKWLGEGERGGGEREGGVGEREGGGGEREGEGGDGEREGRDEEEEEEEDPLTESTAEDEVGKLLRSTLQELEAALQV